MKNTWVLLLSFVGASLVAAPNGGKFETDENGFAKTKAEFVSFSIGAVTHCHDSATKANGAIKSFATDIEKVLLKFADPNAEDGLQSVTGTIQKQDLIKYKNGVPTTVCSGWTATHHLFFKLTDQSKVTQLQDEILSLVSTDDVREELSLSAPRPGIFSKTYEDLVDKALRDAHQKARRRVAVLAGDMPNVRDFELIKVGSSKDAAGSVAYDQTGLGGDPSVSAIQNVSVSITRRFLFQLKD